MIDYYTDKNQILGLKLFYHKNFISNSYINFSQTLRFRINNNNLNNFAYFNIFYPFNNFQSILNFKKTYKSGNYIFLCNLYKLHNFNLISVYYEKSGVLLYIYENLGRDFWGVSRILDWPTPNNSDLNSDYYGTPRIDRKGLFWQNKWIVEKYKPIASINIERIDNILDYQLYELKIIFFIKISASFFGLNI